MKRILTKLSVFCFVFAALLAAGCMQDDLENSGSGNETGSTEPTIPGNSVIEAGVFEVLNLDYEGLAAVKSYYQADQYYLAAQALLEYYRSRTGVINGNVNLIAPSISAEEQQWADYALAKGEYRLYNKGYADGDKPYSYMTDKKLDWKKRATAPAEERYQLQRLQWMVPQGKAYRTTLDETYATEWVTVYKDWLTQFPRPTGEVDYEADPASQPEEIRNQLYAWRPIDVAYRVEDQCDLLYYFMQSSNLTPQIFSAFLKNLAEQVEHVKAHYSENEDVKASQSHAVFRAGTIFPEMKNAAEWVESGSGSMNEGLDTKIFDVLNLEYGGLTKVKRAYEINDYYKALEEVLNYYRSRTHGLNPNVDLATSTATANERKWADNALRENGFRFYVKNYYDAAAGTEVPYSYLSGGDINWQLWPSKPDQEERYQLHRHQWMLPQAKTYHDTKDEKYVANWIEVYGDWLRQNPKPDVDLNYTLYPENQAPEYRNAGWSWRPLDVAARINDQCSMLEYYQQSETIDVDWLSTVYWHLDEQVEHIIKNYSTTSNHLITQAQAVTFSGVLFPELKNASKWVESGSTVLNNEVTAQYFPDGWLRDGDLHYHIAGIEDFRSTMLVAQLNGQAHRFPSSYVESMRKMTEVVKNMIYPDYTVPNMTDTRRDTWTKSVLKRNLTNYSNLFPDNDEMLWMATEGVSGTRPETKVKAFPDAGYYVMRTGWTKSDMMMVLQNTPEGPSKKWHRQYDNNTFEFWCKGRNFFPDSGCFTYTNGSDRNKYSASTAHNTLTLNGKNVSSEGRMLLQESKSTSSFDYEVLVTENPSYAGLTHRRAVFMVADKFYVILDEAYGAAAGTVNFNFNITEGTDAQVVLDTSEGGFHTAFDDGNNLLVRTVSPKAGSFATKPGFVSYNIEKSNERKAYQLNVEKTAEEPVTRFITILLPSSDPLSETVKATADAWSSSGAVVRVTIGETNYKLTYTL